MKRNIIFIIILTTIILITSGVTFSVKALNIETVNDKKKIKNIDMFNNEKIINYSYTYDNIDVYVDEQKTEYLIKNDEILGFIKKASKVKIQKNSVITKEQAMDCIRIFIENRISNFGNYTLVTEDYNENYGEFSFVFSRKILGYNTMDIIFIAVDKEGKVNAFYTSNMGEFEKYNNIEIDEENISNFVNQSITDRYSEQVQSICELGRTLKKEDGRLFLEIIVELSLKDGKNIAESLIYCIE